MANEQRGKALARKNAERAAQMKAAGEERTIGRCSVCYRLITVESRKSRYTHRCWV